MDNRREGNSWPGDIAGRTMKITGKSRSFKELW